MEENENSLYLIVRNGIPTSGKPYQDKNDPELIGELEQWKRILERWPDGTKVSVKTITRR